MYDVAFREICMQCVLRREVKLHETILKLVQVVPGRKFMDFARRLLPGARFYFCCKIIQPTARKHTVWSNAIENI